MNEWKEIGCIWMYLKSQWVCNLFVGMEIFHYALEEVWELGSHLAYALHAFSFYPHIVTHSKSILMRGID